MKISLKFLVLKKCPKLPCINKRDKKAKSLMMNCASFSACFFILFMATNIVERKDFFLSVSLFTGCCIVTRHVTKHVSVKIQQYLS